MPYGALRTLTLLLYLCTFSPPPEEGGIYSNQMNLRLMGGPSKEGTPELFRVTQCMRTFVLECTT